MHQVKKLVINQLRPVRTSNWSRLVLLGQLQLQLSLDLAGDADVRATVAAT